MPWIRKSMLQNGLPMIAICFTHFWVWQKIGTAYGISTVSSQALRLLPGQSSRTWPWCLEQLPCAISFGLASSDSIAASKRLLKLSQAELSLRLGRLRPMTFKILTLAGIIVLFSVLASIHNKTKYFKKIAELIMPQTWGSWQKWHRVQRVGLPSHLEVAGGRWRRTLFSETWIPAVAINRPCETKGPHPIQAAHSKPDLALKRLELVKTSPAPKAFAHILLWCKVRKNTSRSKF